MTELGTTNDHTADMVGPRPPIAGARLTNYPDACVSARVSAQSR